jgi:hypothetical protein
MKLMFIYHFVTAKGHLLPQFLCSINMLDFFFCIRLMCVLLDTCSMCFDCRSQKRKLDNFLVFFQVCSLSISFEACR